MASVLDLAPPTSRGLRGTANEVNRGFLLQFSGGQFWLTGWHWNSRLEEDGSRSNWWGWQPTSHIDSLALGDDPLLRWPALTRSGVEQRLGLVDGILPDLPWGEVYAHYINGSLADPTGQTRIRPRRMGPQQGLIIDLHNCPITIWSEAYSRDLLHPNFKGAMDVRWHDFRQAAAPLESMRAGIDQDRLISYLERKNGFDSLKYFGNLSQSNLDVLVPPEWLSGEKRDADGNVIQIGLRQPSTQIEDTFVEASSDTNLESHTPTGTNPATGWSVVRGGTGAAVVIASSDDCDQVATNPGCSYRISAGDLSGDDIGVQALCTISINGLTFSARHIGLCARFSTSADTYYVGGFVRNNDVIASWEIHEVTAGSFSQLATTTGGESSSNQQMRFEISSGSMELFGDNYATSKLTASDATLTTGRPGISGSHTGANRASWDSWLAEDLAGGATFSASPVAATLTVVSPAMKQALKPAAVAATLTPVVPTFTQVYRASPVVLQGVIASAGYAQAVDVSPVALIATPAAATFTVGKIFQAAAVQLTLTPASPSLAQAISASPVVVQGAIPGVSFAQVLGVSAVGMTLTIPAAVASNPVPYTLVREIVSLGDNRSIATIADERVISSVGDQREIRRLG